MSTLKKLMGVVCIIAALCAMVSNNVFVGVVGIIIGGMLVFGE